MSTLYELTGQMIDLMEMLEDPELDEKALLDTLEGLEGEYNDKVEGWCKVIKSLEAEQKALKEESKRLSNRAAAIENNLSRMKNFVMDSLRATGRQEAGNVLKARIQRNGGQLPIIYSSEAKDVPNVYRKTTYSFDTDMIRAVLDSGESLDFAKYGERGESLRIK